MRIVVTSDSHGRSSNVFDIIERHIDNANLFISLGDCNSGDDLENAKLYFGKKLFIREVCGNCDFRSTAANEDMITFSGKKIFYCHGHTYYVKHGYEMLFSEAKARGADIALFGHTHTPYYKFSDNIHLFNPGSATSGDYGIIDITPGGIMCINARL